MSTLIQFRRDTAANWASANPTLAEGELGLVTDTGQYKIGNGVDHWNDLPQVDLTGTVNSLDMNSIPDPSAPAAGGLTLYAKAVANRQMPAFIGPSGLNSPLQPLIARNKVGMWIPPGNAVTVPGVTGYTAPTAIGTATARNVALTNMFTRMRRLGYVSAGTAGSFTGVRVPATQIAVGDGSGLGGFLKIIRWGISDASVVATARTFVGVSASVSAPSNVEPSTLTNVVGMGHGASDTNMKLFYGGTTAQTPIDLGANFPANTRNTDAYELALFAPINSSDVHFEVTRLNTGHVSIGSLASSGGVAVPGPAVLLGYNMAWRCNNATAAAVGLDIMSDYIETDS